MDSAVIYFSGTGNSLVAAKELSQRLGFELIGLTREYADDCKGKELVFDRLVLVFPSYAYGMPKMVKRFLKDTQIKCNYLAAAVTCGSSAGGTLNSVKRVLNKKDTVLSYGVNIQTVENYIPLFGCPNKGSIERDIEAQNQAVLNIAEDIAHLKLTNIKGVKPFSAMVSGIFLTASPLIAKFIRIDKDCSGCGLCQKICPAEAIEIGKKGRAKIKASRCNHCQACMNICLERAITHLRLTKKGGRYVNPQISLNDLIKR